MVSLDQSLKAALMYGLLPIWAAAGLGDWLCHKAERMELTSGWTEAVLHALMLATLGVATVAVLTLQINAGVLAWLLVACTVHEILFWCDLVSANRHRKVGPLEQWIHCIQFAVPWVGLVGLSLLHRDQVLAAVDMNDLAADWTLRWKSTRLPTGYTAGVLVSCTVLVVLPFAEELWRCWRVRTARTAPMGAPTA